MTPKIDERLDTTASRIRGYVDSAHHNLLKTLEIRTDSLHTRISTLSGKISNRFEELNYETRVIKTRLEKLAGASENHRSTLDWLLGVTAVNLVISIGTLCYILAKFA